ncbi:hypothetical protein HOQ57_gp01 [uncultured phage_MedDCM-OCT-S39-C11]|jgi:hypothetical protein|uniref:Unnamed protein product n=1 Tax=uncultured phage_MedDCM-OCT-S39-C11 TaxID=2740805 RepID=A0A6S4P7X1_9CAUD|nr:hypothetical protein HOQ57_gp01 [uncultured phage_MedDCM-OCT-S39-C11]BAQ94471.1 unnamed protein product [uncultured phage_MedDCM-OCT-S39-C11]
MKTQLFEVPGSLRVERQEPREGPTPIYVAWKPGTSQTFRERSPLLKFIAWPASTPTGRRFRDWLDELQQAPSRPSEVDMARIKAEGFGPEAHEEPNDNTKMIT